MNVNQYIPALNWWKTYDKTQFRSDLGAGLTVGVMLIPQGMAYALIAGLPPIYGLYASTIPLVIYAFLGTSRQLAVGPTAMVSLLTAAGIGALAGGDMTTYIALAITLAFMVGVIQLSLGVFKLGVLVNFLSHPVISGFTSAAAIIIALSQLKHLLGVDTSRTKYPLELLLQLSEKIYATHWTTLVIGVGAILLIKATKRWLPFIPAPLVVVVLGIVVVKVFGLDEQGVRVIGTIPMGLPSLTVPAFSWSIWKTLFPVAIVISLVSFMESYAVARVIQTKHKNYEVQPNQELIALGLANIGGAFWQSFPVTGGFSRTAVNDQAGAKTGIASLLSAGLILLTLLFLTPLFYHLPKAVLAAIILVAVYGLIDFKTAKQLWTINRSDFWMLIITFLTTLGIGIEAGIGIGIVFSLAMIIIRTSRPHIAEIGQVPNTHFYRNVARFEEVLVRPDVLIIRFDAQLYFANCHFFSEKVAEFVAKKGTELKYIILKFDSINNLDSSAIHTLEDIVKNYQARNIVIFLSGIKGPVRDAMERAGLLKHIGNHHFFMSVQKAIDFIDNNCNKATKNPFDKYLFQTNN